MNVLPKKRAHQFVRNLTLLRQVTLPRNLALPRNLTKSMRSFSLKIPFANLISRQVVWYAVSLVTYAWFLSWIAYDILVWHKSVTQVSLTNYVGAITAMALIWAGAVIFNAPTPGVLEPLRRRPKNVKEKVPRKRTRKPSKLMAAPSVKLEQLPTVQPEPRQEPPSLLKSLEEKTASSPRCSRHIKNSLEIPDGCLTCKDLIQCLYKVGK